MSTPSRFTFLIEGLGPRRALTWILVLPALVAVLSGPRSAHAEVVSLAAMVGSTAGFIPIALLACRSGNSALPTQGIVMCESGGTATGSANDDHTVEP